MLSCGLTHTAIVPLDLVKCRMQVDPGKYKGILSGFGVTVRNYGLRGLARAWAPTFLGYSLQGLFKFGLYDVFRVDRSSVDTQEVQSDTRARARAKQKSPPCCGREISGYWLLVPVLVLRLLGTTPVFIKEKMGTVSLFVDS